MSISNDVFHHLFFFFFFTVLLIKGTVEKWDLQRDALL